MKVLATRPEATVSPEAMAEHVAAVVDEAGAAARVMVSSFNWRAVRHFRAIRPEIPRAFLTEPATVSPLWWGAAHPGSVPQAVAAEGGGTWSPRHDGLTRAALQEAHALGLCVVPWTVNALPDMQRLAAWGVDGLITDAPDLWLAAAAV
jgi:glycerophosphoryl diester phosphodiesterase